MRIGVIGGGQLGMMLAESIQKMKHEVISFDPADDPPISSIVQCSRAPWDDVAALQEFFNSCDRVTYEFENVSTAGLRRVESLDKLWPSLHVLETCQNRKTEKLFLSQHGFPSAPFDFETPLQFPCVAKSLEGGYDGHAQERLYSEADLQKWRAHCVREQVFEDLLKLKKEVSCIVVRDAAKKSQAFPVFENEHEDGILRKTRCPARIDASTAKTVESVALAIAERLDVVGLLCVEMFLVAESAAKGGVETTDGWLVVNELAPRPHNSGHVTRFATTVSQFDALAHILVGEPLSPITLRDGRFEMINLLGTETPSSFGLDDSECLEVKWYGKKEARPRRKMGHVIRRVP